VWRKLNPGQQALLVLVYLRKGEPFAQVGAGFDVSTTTCWRYVNETVDLLATRAPTLREALRKAKRQGMAYVIIDGTLVPVDRVAVDRPVGSWSPRWMVADVATASVIWPPLVRCSTSRALTRRLVCWVGPGCR
jgi:hypothetical protein